MQVDPPRAPVEETTKESVQQLQTSLTTLDAQVETLETGQESQSALIVSLQSSVTANASSIAANDIRDDGQDSRLDDLESNAVLKSTTTLTDVGVIPTLTAVAAAVNAINQLLRNQGLGQ